MTDRQPPAGSTPPAFDDGRAGERSRELYERACVHIPGGVNSPVRAFSSVGGHPPFIRKASGCHVITEDGAALVDYVGSWGPALIGHAHPEVVDAVVRAARDGLSFGAATAAEIDFADLICDMVPGLNDGLVRLVSSGTEATMSALRLARGATGRDKIIKCDGGYHGHADMLLAAAGSGAATLGIPGSAGVPEGAVRDTLIVPYNDLEATAAVLAAHKDQIAAIIIEPIAGNMGCIPPQPGYLEGLRTLCDEHGTLLIFDEVMTGFRVAIDSAQGRFGVTPDLTCLGKIVGGGMPVGAYGGKREIMEKIAPLGPVYQAGTLSGNPLAVAAGMTTLRILKRETPHEALEANTTKLVAAIGEAAAKHGVTFSSSQVGAMFGGFFRAEAPKNYAEAKECDTEAFARFFQGMLSRGVYLAPSQFEAAFMSTAHDDAAIELTLAAADATFAEMAS
jgi:glutamate-1-semialdehyde 2,1-aminomutase